MSQYCARIIQTVEAIPEGKVCSYGQIADFAGLPGRARLVGTCLRNMPNNKSIPWHRVLKSNGHIAFPKGSEGAHRQTELLQSEGVAVIRHRVDMRIYVWQPDLSEMLQKLAF